jgi:hypothetical protein
MMILKLVAQVLSIKSLVVAAHTCLARVVRQHPLQLPAFVIAEGS